MTTSLRTIVLGALAMVAACSDVAPTATTAVEVTDAGVASAQAPSASCTYVPNGGNYDVTVTWSGFSVASIDLYAPGGGQPLAQTIFTHPTRRGSITYSNVAQPGFAQLTGRQGGLRVACNPAA
jgi:hypothetical protein